MGSFSFIMGPSLPNPSHLARPSDAELLRQDAQGHGGTASLKSGGWLCPSSKMCIVWVASQMEASLLARSAPSSNKKLGVAARTQ